MRSDRYVLRNDSHSDVVEGEPHDVDMVRIRVHQQSTDPRELAARGVERIRQTQQLMTHLEDLVFNNELSQKDEFNIKECTICLEEFKNGDKITRIPLCNHFFHPDCIKKWLNRKKDEYKCPLCNTVLTIDVLKKALK